MATPWISRSKLWEQSGHWYHYKENMFCMESEGETLAVKPMNCPNHCLMYKEETRSYRDLPLRLAEYGPLSRYELSGTLHGLMRVRGFHQDDAHIYVTEDQIEGEISQVLELFDVVYSTLGLSVQHQVFDAARGLHGQASRPGTGPKRRSPGRWKSRAAATSSTRETARFTGPSSTSTSPMPWAECGNAPPFNWITSCPSALT